jgi:hypothetical protein
MAGFLFRLDTVDGAPAEPSTIQMAVPNMRVGDSVPLGKRTCAWSECATTTPISLRC